MRSVSIVAALATVLLACNAPPAGHVRRFFASGPAGHADEYIALPTSVGSDWYDNALLHELSHYYWGSNLGWVNEGAASIIEDIIDEPRDGKSVDADNHPCPFVRTIAELEQTDFYPCTYTLGKRIFLDLYRTIGYEAFSDGIGALYLTLTERPIGIDDLRTAFTAAAPQHADAIGSIIARWLPRHRARRSAHARYAAARPCVAGHRRVRRSRRRESGGGRPASRQIPSR